MGRRKGGGDDDRMEKQKGERKVEYKVVKGI
jgi:hypothetical protein